MTDTSLIRSVLVLHSHLCDSLVTSLEKARALIEVATFEPFPDCPKAIIHNYLCALSGVIDSAIAASDKLCQMCQRCEDEDSVKDTD